MSFFTVEKSWEEIRIGVLEATVIAVVKFGSEVYALRKTVEDLLDVFQRNCLRIRGRCCLCFWLK